MKIKTCGLLMGLILVSVAGSQQLEAVGFRLPNQDPEAIARGNAFVATADNPSAIYHNPAGITQLEGHNISMGVYIITTDIEFENSTGGRAQSKTDPRIVPQIHYVFTPENSDFSFGLGLYFPFGLSAEYEDGSPFTTEGEEASLLYGTLNPVVAYKINEQLTVAAGITFNYSDFELVQSVFPGGVGEFRFEGDGYGVGYNVGILYKPHEQFSIGITHRGPTVIEYEGDTSVNTGLVDLGSTPTEGKLRFPLYVDFGISYRPTPDWNIEFNIDWTDWDSVNTSVLDTTPVGDVPIPLNYESSFMYEIGVTHYVTPRVLVSTGYIYSENSVPDETLLPLNPDADLHLWGIGISYRGESLSLALGYHFGYNGGRDVSGNTPSAFGESANGRFETFNNAVNVSAGYRF